MRKAPALDSSFVRENEDCTLRAYRRLFFETDRFVDPPFSFAIVPPNVNGRNVTDGLDISVSRSLGNVRDAASAEPRRANYGIAQKRQKRRTGSTHAAQNEQ